jgi:serine/threonine protein kinase
MSNQMADSGHSIIAADPALNIRHGALSHAYELHRVLGQGAHGEAILATRLEDGEQVVVKQIRLSDMEERAMQEALQEVRLLSHFDHVNIVHYYECVLEVRVSEYQDCHSLQSMRCCLCLAFHDFCHDAFFLQMLEAKIQINPGCTGPSAGLCKSIKIAKMSSIVASVSHKMFV